MNNGYCSGAMLCARQMQQTTIMGRLNAVLFLKCAIYPKSVIRVL